MASSRRRRRRGGNHTSAADSSADGEAAAPALAAALAAAKAKGSVFALGRDNRTVVVVRKLDEAVALRHFSIASLKDAWMWVICPAFLCVPALHHPVSPTHTSGHPTTTHSGPRNYIHRRLHCLGAAVESDECPIERELDEREAEDLEYVGVLNQPQALPRGPCKYPLPPEPRHDGRLNYMHVRNPASDEPIPLDGVGPDSIFIALMMQCVKIKEGEEPQLPELPAGVPDFVQRTWDEEEGMPSRHWYYWLYHHPEAVRVITLPEHRCAPSIMSYTYRALNPVPTSITARYN